jgi:hypothetical protein
MSRLSMSCYAATKHSMVKENKDNKIARVQVEKPRANDRPKKYGEVEILLDKYNGKLMNSIWGLYNRNSPHNFKSLNDIDAGKANEHGGAASGGKSAKSFVTFSIPQFDKIVAFETSYEVQKPKMSLEKIESVFNFPMF